MLIAAAGAEVCKTSAETVLGRSPGLFLGPRCLALSVAGGSVVRVGDGDGETVSEWDMTEPAVDGWYGPVDDALAALDDLERRPVGEHVAVFEAVHAALAEQLALGED